MPNFLQNDLTAALVWGVMLIREGFIVYYMARLKPLPGFQESYDLLADIVLLIVLAFGQLAVGEVFRDMRIKGLSNVTEIAYLLFPIVLFFMVFYLPMRYIYTIEDFTFSRKKWEKIEQVISFLVIFIGFLLAG